MRIRGEGIVVLQRGAAPARLLVTVGRGDELAEERVRGQRARRDSGPLGVERRGAPGHGPEREPDEAQQRGPTRQRAIVGDAQVTQMMTTNGLFGQVGRPPQAPTRTPEVHLNEAIGVSGGFRRESGETGG